MSQRELAAKLEVRPWTVEQIEAGHLDPKQWAGSLELIFDRPEGWLAHDSDSATGSSSRPEHRQSSDRCEDPLGRDLVIGVVVTLVVVRFFTTTIPILPGAGNFVDLVLLPALVAFTLLRTAPHAYHGSRIPRYAGPAGFFFAVIVISAVLNLSRVAPGPTLLFIYGFLSPLVFYWATVRLWPAGSVLAFSRTIVVLGLLQFAVVLLFDLPDFLSTRNPDDIAGTFAGNAYQLVFFLLIFSALVAGIAALEPNRTASHFAPVIFVCSFVVIFLAQYRALLVSAAVTILFVAALISIRRGKGVVVGAAAIVAFLAGLGYVTTHFPTFKILPTIEAVRDDPTFFVMARVAPAKDVLNLYADEPLFAVTGTGPGTYSSRAWRTFNNLGDPSNPNEGAAQPYIADLTGGVEYNTDVSARYVTPKLENQESVLGSYAVSTPFSSYVALAAEVGLVGAALMVFVYIRAFLASTGVALRVMRERPSGDPLPAVVLATATAFFLLLQMAFLENWWEVARVTVPSWIMLGVCVKEYAARRVAPEE